MLTKPLLVSSFLFATISIALGNNPQDTNDSPSTIDRRKCSDNSLSEFSSRNTLGIHQDILSSEHQAPLNIEPPPTYNVPLPHLNPTKSFWLDIPGANPLADEGSTGALSTRDADVCIIGSGITGVSAAWHLKRMLSEDAKRRSVVILEARRFCSGATGRNGGHLTRNVFTSFQALSSLYNTSEALKSYDLEAHTANSLLEFIKEKGLESAVDLVRGGHVAVFKTAEEEMDARRDWEGVRDARKEANEDVEGVEWIDADEMHKRYGVDRRLNYSGARFVGHNLWPCKLVTQLFEDTSGGNIDVFLHTKTPVTGITRLSNSSSDSNARRWELTTPRGEVSCDYVVHATNGYAAHLLPFLSGASIPASDLDPWSFGLTSLHPSTSTSSTSSSVSHSSDGSLPRARGAYGIKPTRGQVGAVRASVNASTFRWLESWDDGPEGWNYWFPRYQDILSSANEGPLIILGGERHAAVEDGLEVGNADDSTINPLVSGALRKFLPGFYEGKFDSDGGGWEMEWTGIMAYTKTGDPFVGPVINPLIERSSTTMIPAHSEGEGEYEGQYIAAGYSGHGMPRAYGCAEAVAGMIVAKMRGEVWAKPAWLPERYLTWATEA